MRQFGDFWWKDLISQFPEKIANLAIFGEKRQLGGFWRKIANLAVFGEKSPIWRFLAISRKNRQFGDFRRKAPIWRFLAKNRQFGDFWQKRANLAIFDENIYPAHYLYSSIWPSNFISQDSSVSSTLGFYPEGPRFKSLRGQKWNSAKNCQFFFYKLRRHLAMCPHALNLHSVGVSKNLGVGLIKTVW